ncbi:hypothetical protein HDU79_009193 [Rhizoclosmatium sp. JEL0117]|nr:hypothetical protein HDU79_009193 [Rhizoclosmatium sp. JEL0117]
MLAMDASTLFAVSFSQWSAEDKEDRQLDAQDLNDTLYHLVNNDYKILDSLELKEMEFLEAIDAIQKSLSDHVDRSLERTVDRLFLTKALSHLREATNTASKKHEPPPEWLVTSFEFDLGPVIGTGGFGEVLKATWLSHTVVAVKRLHIRLDTSKLRDDFLREVKTWYPLRHPNILPLLGACISAPRPFMVSPYMARGHALQYLEWCKSNLLQSGGSIEPHGIRLLYETSLGMQYLHARGVIHGDLKAANIFVDEFGASCIGDFGFASLKRYTTTKTVSMPSAPPPNVGGTLRWMSPERMQGGRATNQCDVYAYAMTCFEVISEGEIPFLETPDALIVHHVVNLGIRPVLEADECLYVRTFQGIYELMRQCWNQDPQARPSFLNVSLKMKALVAESNGSGPIRPVIQLKAPPPPITTAKHETIQMIEQEIDRLSIDGATLSQSHEYENGGTRKDDSQESDELEEVEDSEPEDEEVGESFDEEEDPVVLNSPIDPTMPLPLPVHRFFQGSTGRQCFTSNFKRLEIVSTGGNKGVTEVIVSKGYEEDTNLALFEFSKRDHRSGPTELFVVEDEGVLRITVKYPFPVKEVSRRFLTAFGIWETSVATKIRLTLPQTLFETFIQGDWVDVKWDGPTTKVFSTKLKTGSCVGSIGGYANCRIDVGIGNIDVSCFPAILDSQANLHTGKGNVKAMAYGFKGKVKGSSGLGQLAMIGVENERGGPGDVNANGSSHFVRSVGGMKGAKGSFVGVVGLGDLTLSFL